VLVCAPKKAPVYALRLDRAAPDAERLLWKSGGRDNPLSSDVPTPLHLDGRFFVLSDVERKLSRVDPETGKAEWTIELPDRSPWEASPTGADGKVYCLSHSGLALVVDAKTGEILCQTRMAEEDADTIRSSIAIAHGCLFVRTNDALYCIGS
jgi:outer membrane protein assembly factor BamB